MPNTLAVQHHALCPASEVSLLLTSPP